MDVDIVTLFPGMFAGPFGASIIGRAIEQGLLQVRLVPLREFGLGRHRVVDDTPYGGGPGMVLKPEPLVAAVESVRRPESTVVLTTPRGRLFTQALARELAARPHLVLVCGHYEGVDERVVAVLGAEEVSIGDFVLTGGELPAMVIVDAVARLLPGVLGAEASPAEESHSAGLLEYPQYTRPVEFRGLRVPAVLLGGNHAAIARWRRLQSLVLTLTRRPELLRPEHWAELRLLALAGELPGPEGWGEGAAGESSGGR